MIVKLLLRLYDPTKGMIRIAGRDIRSIDPTELHQLFGVVLQKDAFCETIEENIALAGGFPEQIEKRRLAPKPRSLSINYLSSSTACQRQQFKRRSAAGLVIAGIGGEPEILILDDSASALDYRTDAQLRRS